MTTVLERYEKLPSWSAGLPRVPVYGRLDDASVRDIDMRTVMRTIEKPTLNLDSRTGFDEVYVLDPQTFWQKEYAHLLEAGADQEMDLELEARAIIRHAEEYFVNTWDPSKRHFIASSGGRDSRIIALVLKRLEQTEGKAWLGEVNFCCHGDECETFERAMDDIGWDRSQYHAHEFQRRNEPDYYDYADFGNNVNAYWPPALRFWKSFFPAGENVQAVYGTFGNWLGRWVQLAPKPRNPFKRWLRPTPAPRLTQWQRRFPPAQGNTWNDLYSSRFTWPFFFYSELFVEFDDMLDPLSSYGVVDIATRMPRKWVERPPGPKQAQSLIRDKVLELLGNRVEIYEGHRYNLALSEESRKRIKESFESSRLYADFPEVRSFEPWHQKNVATGTTPDAKVYGLATMYEGI